MQILYVLGGTLESLGHISEALETYRWLRREGPQYRDVAMRIESLSTSRCSARISNPSTIDFVDVAEFPAEWKVTVDRKRFLVVGYELIS
ncbi:MAG: hypothetical protein ABIU05_02280 [Nitrospirales bacterium]